MSRKIRTPSTVKTLKPHWSTHSAHWILTGPFGFPSELRWEFIRLATGRADTMALPGWEAAYLTRIDNTKGMEVDEITIADQLGLDPSCQVCSTRSQRSRKHWNANEGLSIEMVFTPPNLWPWQVASRSFEAFNASRSFSTAWIAACAGPADTRYPSNTGIWFAMTNRTSFYHWDANRKLVTPHFIQINPQQLRGVHLGFEVHSGIQSKVPQQSLQFILLCCTKKTCGRQLPFCKLSTSNGHSFHFPLGLAQHWTSKILTTLRPRRTQK